MIFGHILTLEHVYEVLLHHLVGMLVVGQLILMTLFHVYACGIGNGYKHDKADPKKNAIVIF